MKTEGAARLREQILAFPQQLPEGALLARNIRVPRPAELVLVGMGGSALYADLLVDHLGPELKIPARVHRGYSLPLRVDKHALVVVSSYSGGTEETLSAYREARRRKLAILVLTHGGTLLQLARRDRVPFVYIPECAQPRYSLGHMFAALHQVLSRAGLVHSCEAELARLAAWLRGQRVEPLGKKLAGSLNGSIPLVYSSPGYEAAARTAKIKFNENAKVPAFHNALPELNHNEMVGFTRPLARFHAFILTDGRESGEMKRRVRSTRETLESRGLRASEVRLKGRSWLERSFYALLLFDWTSYHLARVYGIDPLPVELVERFKARLRGV